MLAAAAACVLAFFVTTPFALIDLPAFLNGFGTQAAAFTARPVSAEASWIIYAKHLRQAFGWPAALLAVGGLLVAMFRAFAGPARVTWALLLVFPAVYFYLINGWGFMFARYALPAVPFIAIWAAIAVDRLAARLAVPGIPAAARHATVVIVLLAMVPGAIGSIQFVRTHGTQTTQALAWAWMKKSIWPNSAILSEARGLDLPPNGTGPKPCPRWRNATLTPSCRRASSGWCFRRTRGGAAPSGQARVCQRPCRRPTRRSWRAPERPK